ncbi:hypothetical protein D918_09734 [Trichuris suis]|nr:hypothetical protein D918_09734 [Trichuris suis]
MCTRKPMNSSSDNVRTTSHDEDTFADQESNRTDFNKKRIQYYVDEENRLLNDLREIVGISTTAKRLWSTTDVRVGAHGSGSALLISMWHLTNFLFHLRRENDHLRKQVQCMDEMRKVERLQSELLQTACACAAAGQSGNVATSLDAESGYEASSCSQPGDIGSQLFSASSKWTGCSSTVEALASLEPLRNNGQVQRSSLDTPSSSLLRRPHLVSLLQSTLNDGKKETRSTSRNDDFLDSSMEPVRKDSDEPIFSEVLLPNYGSKRESGAKQRHSAFRMSHISTTSSTAYYTPVSLPDTSTPSRVGRLLERFGFKKGGMRRLALSSPLTTTSAGESINYGINVKPQSLLKDPSRKATRCDDSVAAAPKLLCTRKVFQKKRKRKISESDSWPSSEATGKLYSMVEIPEKFELPSDRAGPSHDRKVLAKRELSDGMGAGQAVSSVEKKQSSGLRVEEIVEPKESTTQNLKSSDAETNTFFGKRLPTAGQRNVTDRLRPVSLLDTNCMFGNSASETDIDHLSPQYKGEQSPSSRLSLLVDDHRYFDEHSLLESILLPTNSKRSDAKEAEKLSISPSQMTVSNDSVFTSHETDLNGCVSGINVLKQLLALQEKNSILIRQLREKTNEYESIVERVANLEESMRMLRNRLRFNNFLDTICRKSAKRQYITAEVANALEAQIKRMEQSMKELKADSYRSQAI